MNKRIFVVSPWRRFSKATLSFSRQTGFSIIELMMSLVLLAIGTALSLPSYRQMVEKRQLTHGAEQIMAFVNTMQSEAMKRNQVVTVSYTLLDGGDWCVGAALGDAACDCTETVDSETDYCVIDSVPRILNGSNLGDSDLVKSMTGDGAYSFDPVRGIFTDLNDSLVVAMSSYSEDYQLDLTVNVTGQVILCSKDSSHSVPGYQVCPS